MIGVPQERLRQLLVEEDDKRIAATAQVEAILAGVTAAHQTTLTPAQEDAFRDAQSKMRVAMGRCELLSRLVAESLTGRKLATTW